jgi:hypothetical protein
VLLLLLLLGLGLGLGLGLRLRTRGLRGSAAVVCAAKGLRNLGWGAAL